MSIFLATGIDNGKLPMVSYIYVSNNELKLTGGKQMTQTQTTNRQRPVAVKHERLSRLDRELMTERTKAFDYLYARHNGVRVRVCIMRNPDGQCFATAQVGDKVFRAEGGFRPSTAFFQLGVAVKSHIAQLTENRRIQLRRESTALAA